jgi:hypothetical protein
MLIFLHPMRGASTKQRERETLGQNSAAAFGVIYRTSECFRRFGKASKLFIFISLQLDSIKVKKNH